MRARASGSLHARVLHPADLTDAGVCCWLCGAAILQTFELMKRNKRVQAYIHFDNDVGLNEAELKGAPAPSVVVVVVVVADLLCLNRSQEHDDHARVAAHQQAAPGHRHAHAH